MQRTYAGCAMCNENKREATPEQIAQMVRMIADHLEGFECLRGNLAELTAEAIMGRLSDAFVLLARPECFPPEESCHPS